MKPVRSAICLRRDGVRWNLLPEFEETLDEVLDAPVDSAHRTPVKAITRHSARGRVFFVKRYLHGATLVRPAKYFFKSPRSRLEWQRARLLRDRAIPVVPHLAHGERWGSRGLLESVLITESPDGYLPLSAVDDQATENLQRALGTFLRRLHDAGVWHSDLHADNLLYSPTTQALLLVDLDKIELKPSLGDEERLDNLALLGACCPLSE